MDNFHHKPKHLSYRADIDGLRALAVLSVIGFHAFPNWLTGGFVGVDVFFVISGFLISTILFQSLENDTFSFKDFYRKRIKRIFPALITVLIFCFVLGWFVLFPQEYRQLSKHISAGAGFISNFVLWFDSGYFDNTAETKPLLHLWSLGIEEQFYLLWPLMIWIAWKKQFNLLTLTLLILLLSFLFNIISINSYAVATFYSPHTRFWELLCGSLLAWITVYKPDAFDEIKNKSDKWLTRSELNNTLSLTGLLILAGCMYFFSKEISFPGGWALLPVLGALLLIMAGTETWVNRVILSNRVMVWFGLISYPLYLWHWPLLSFARIMEDDTPHKYIRIVAVILSVILAWLTYKLIEKPIRTGIGSFDKTKVPSLLISMLVIACFAIYVKKNHGLEFRIKQIMTPSLALIADPLPALKKKYSCSDTIPLLKKFQFNGLCISSRKTQPEIMFLGDSHTWHLQNAVWKQFAAKSVLMVVEVSCLPFAGDSLLQGECREKYDAVVSFLESNKSIKKIYLSGYWAYLMSGGFESDPGTRVNWRRTKPLSEDGTKSFIKNGRMFLTKMLNTKKEIIFFKDIPDLDFNVSTCFEVRPIRLPFRPPNHKKCSMDYDYYKQRVTAYDKVIDELLKGFPQIKVYNPRPLFCKEGRCTARDDTLPYYFNGDHLNQYGANIVIKDMLIKTT